MHATKVVEHSIMRKPVVHGLTIMAVRAAPDLTLHPCDLHVATCSIQVWLRVPMPVCKSSL